MTDQPDLPAYDGDEHTVWDELAAGAALHALEPDEQQLFDLHLETCTRCRRLLDEHDLVAAQLGSLSAGSDELRVPAWDRIAPGVLGHPAAGDELTARRARRRKGSELTGVRRLMAAAAAVVVLAGGGVAAWRLTSSNGPASLCSGVAGCHAIVLRSDADQALVDLVVRGDTATIRPVNMEQPPHGKAYVLWQIGRSHRPWAIGSMAAGSPVTRSLVLPYSRTAAFAVSLESAGNLPAHPHHLLAVGPAS